jgi:hypothetical protein
VKSQSNLRESQVNPGQKAFPENPEDVKDWIKRRKSADTIKANGESPAITVFELADTSPIMARPPTPLGSESKFAVARKKKYRV